MSALNATSRSGRSVPADKILDTRSLAGEWTPQSVWTRWSSENLSIPGGNRTPINSTTQAVPLRAQPYLLPSIIKRHSRKNGVKMVKKRKGYS